MRFIASDTVAAESIGVSRPGVRNMVINGAMQVHQRGTSTASITTSGYYTADRFAIGLTSLGTWTQTIENDAPTGSGFRKSAKMLCTTADASPAASDYLIFYQVIERQNLQQVAKGTTSAKQVTLTFWTKSGTTGNYVVEMYDNENARAVGALYTISAANTWEKKTVTFPADTVGTFTNDNGAGISLGWWLGAGTTFTSGTLGTVWGTTTANRAVGQTNLAATVNNYWQITGVQLEVGTAATPFEFEDYGTTLQKCMRYFQTYVDPMLRGVAGNDTRPNRMGMVLPVPMRVAPTAYSFSGSLLFWDGNGSGSYLSTQAAYFRSTSAEFDFNLSVGYTTGRAIVLYTGGGGTLSLSAEL